MSLQLKQPFLNPDEYSAIHDGVENPPQSIDQLRCVATHLISIFTDLDSIKEGFNRYRGYASQKEKAAAEQLEIILLDCRLF